MKPHGTFGPGLVLGPGITLTPLCDSSMDMSIPGPKSLRSHVPSIHKTVSGAGPHMRGFQRLHPLSRARSLCPHPPGGPVPPPRGLATFRCNSPSASVHPE